MRSLSVYMYAALDDLDEVMDAVEECLPVKYTLTGLYEEEPVGEIYSYHDIKDRGKSNSGHSVSSHCYLVTPLPVNIEVERIDRGRFNKPLLHVGRAHPPIAVRMTPGGIYDGRAIIEGEISTSYVLGEFSDEIKSFFRMFNNNIKKRFTREGYYWVGPAAMDLRQKGYVLTREAI